MKAGPVDFICLGCGSSIHTYRWINYRTIPPSMDERDLCEACKKSEEGQMKLNTSGAFPSVAERGYAMRWLMSAAAGVGPNVLPDAARIILKMLPVQSADGVALQSTAHPGAATELPEGALIRDYVKLPKLEIEWSVTPANASDQYLLFAGVAGDKQISFRLSVMLQRDSDLEWATQHLRAALEAAVNTYRSPKT